MRPLAESCPEHSNHENDSRRCNLPGGICERASGVVTIANDRISNLLEAFLDKHSELFSGSHLDSVVLDLRRSHEVDALCRRISRNLDLSLDDEPKATLAALFERINQLRENCRRQASAIPLLEAATVVDDSVATAAIFELILSAVSLPYAMDGVLFGEGHRAERNRTT